MLHPPGKDICIDGGIKGGGGDELAVYTGANGIGPPPGAPVDEPIGPDTHRRIGVGPGHILGTAHFISVDRRKALLGEMLKLSLKRLLFLYTRTWMNPGFFYGSSPAF